jgi:hypothetical protein
LVTLASISNVVTAWATLAAAGATALLAFFTWRLARTAARQAGTESPKGREEVEGTLRTRKTPAYHESAGRMLPPIRFRRLTGGYLQAQQAFSSLG